MTATTATMEKPAQETAPEQPQEIAATAERFEITDQRGAEWYLRKQAAIAREIALVKAQAAQRVRELESDAGRLASLYEPQVIAWARGESEKRRRKSVTTLYGTVAFRTVPAGLKLADPDAALPHAHSLGFTVTKTTTAIDADAYLKAAAAKREETGELLPGVDVRPERESAKVTFAGTDTGEADA